MNREVLDDPRWKDQIVPALKSIPTMSIVAPLDSWFNSETGLYSNPREQGKKTEIAGSLELIYPDGKRGFRPTLGFGSAVDIVRPPVTRNILIDSSFVSNTATEN